MHVEAVPGTGAIGLRHEGRDQLVLARHALDDAFEQHRVIRRRQRIGGMQQVDLELADAVFGDGGVGRHALLLALQVHIAEELAEILKLVERQDGIRIEPLAGIGRDRWLRGIRLRIDEVEFELRCHHRLQAMFRIAPQHLRQGLARVAEKRRAGIREQPQRDHGARPGRPVDRHGPAPGGAAYAIGVAAGEHHRVAHDILTPHVDADDGERHANAVLGNPAGLVDRDALAAHDAVEIAHGGVQHFDLGICRQPGDDIRISIFSAHACRPTFLYVISLA